MLNRRQVSGEGTASAAEASSEPNFRAVPVAVLRAAPGRRDGGRARNGGAARARLCASGRGWRQRAAVRIPLSARGALILEQPLQHLRRAARGPGALLRYLPLIGS